MCDYKKLGFQEERFYNFPNIVNLEVLRGVCPCECKHCPVGLVSPKNRKERFSLHYVSLDLLKKIVDEMIKWKHSTIRLHAVGDPILWPDIKYAMQYINKASVHSWIFTSLVTNSKKVLQALCNYCDIVEISVNSINSDDYKKSKGINAFELVKENIRYMAQYIKKNDLKTRLLVSRVPNGVISSDNKFIRYWKDTKLVSEAFVRKYHNYNNLLNYKEKERKSKQKEPCLVHWMRFNIAYDGTVISCFNELFHPILRRDVILGNLNTDSIYNIWHGDKLKKLRQAELNGYEKSAFADDFPCRNCYSCQSYNRNNFTSDNQIAKL